MSNINNTEDIIIIPINIFKEKYKSLNKNDIPEILIKKKNELYNNYECLRISNEHYYINSDKKHYKKIKDNKEYNKQNNPHRLYIISSNFTEEDKIKKTFTGYLNKLTIQNKDNLNDKIVELLETNYKDDLYNIIWDFIKKSNNSHIYIDLLKYYDTNKIESHLIDFIDNKKWYPTIYINTDDLLSSDEAKYNDYCNYVKFKKEITNILNAWCIYCKDMKYINIILENLYSLFTEYSIYKNKKHISDFALEQIYNIMKKYKNIDIINKLKNINIKLLESSTKFLIYNIIELN